MALKDIISRISTEAEKLFHHDPDANRRDTLATLGQNRTVFGDPQARKPRNFQRWFEHGHNNKVAFEPKRPDGQPLIIDGKSVTFWSVDEFPTILDSFEAAINAGELDDQLEGSTPAGASLPAAKITRARKPRDPNAPAKPGWTPERREKFAATMAARKAAK